MNAKQHPLCQLCRHAHETRGVGWCHMFATAKHVTHVSRCSCAKFEQHQEVIAGLTWEREEKINRENAQPEPLYSIGQVLTTEAFGENTTIVEQHFSEVSRGWWYLVTDENDTLYPLKERDI